MGKKADALKVELDTANADLDNLEDWLELAVSAMTPASKKKFGETAGAEVLARFGAAKGK